MKEHPIIFSTDMVKAILEDRKTQTRRVIKPQPILKDSEWTIGKPKFGKSLYWKNEYYGGFPNIAKDCPYGQPRDRLWIRETFAVFVRNVDYSSGHIEYEQTYCSLKERPQIRHYVEYRATTRQEFPEQIQWANPLFMPRWASRITLEITNIRVERLQEISAEDIIAEGLEVYPIPTNFEKFKTLWDSLNAKTYPWSSNPWVWVVEFKKIQELPRKEKG